MARGLTSKANTWAKSTLCTAKRDDCYRFSTVDIAEKIIVCYIPRQTGDGSRLWFTKIRNKRKIKNWIKLEG